VEGPLRVAGARNQAKKWLATHAVLLLDGKRRGSNERGSARLYDTLCVNAHRCPALIVDPGSCLTIMFTVRKRRGAMTAATLTSKGQTTIPKEIRDSLGMKPGDRLTFTFIPMEPWSCG